MNGEAQCGVQVFVIDNERNQVGAMTTKLNS
jgi:hypothetical protein